MGTGVFLDAKSSEPILKDEHEFIKEIGRRLGFQAEHQHRQSSEAGTRSGIPDLARAYCIPGPE